MSKFHPTRRTFLTGAAALAVARPDWPAYAQSASLNYGFSATDVPLTTGQPDRGAGSYQFTGLTIYDPLAEWELDIADRAGKLKPGLATSWESDASDRKNWTIKLREGVKFHDGSAFDADAAIWNLEKIFNTQSPHFDSRQSAQVKPRLPSIASYKKLDATTIQITTKTVDSLFPYQLMWILMSSPAQYEKVGKDWAKFAIEPSGTGPFKMGALVPRVKVELIRNPDYWDKTRMAKAEKITLLCIPETLSRTNALLTGQVDMIDTPAPDLIPQIKQAGMRVSTNVIPHVWNYHLSMLEGSPWRDLRLRRAANLAIDRDAVVALLGGLAIPAVGQLPPGDPWFGNPTFKIKYDPDAARKLISDAGYSVKNPLKVKFIVPTGGTGQMLSLPMNEFIQQSWAEVGIALELQAVEQEVAYTAWRKGAADPSLQGITGGNVAYVTSDPFYAIVRFYSSRQIAPVGVNWSHYKNAEVDALCDRIITSFDTAEQEKLLAKVHEKIVDDAVQVWVVHDTNPRAMSPKIKSYVQARHWFQDLTTLS